MWGPGRPVFSEEFPEGNRMETTHLFEAGYMPHATTKVPQKDWPFATSVIPGRLQFEGRFVHRKGLVLVSQKWAILPWSNFNNHEHAMNHRNAPRERTPTHQPHCATLRATCCRSLKLPMSRRGVGRQACIYPCRIIPG